MIHKIPNCFPSPLLPASFTNSLSYTQQVAILMQAINTLADALKPASAGDYGLVKARSRTAADTTEVKIGEDGFLYVRTPDVSSFEKKGKITISGTEYTANKHVLSWSDGGNNYSYNIVTVG